MSDTIMIPIPAPPEGWVFDAIRKAKNGEQYFRDGRWIHNYFSDTTLIHPVAIPIPPKWTPPVTWGHMFKDCWLAVDGNGDTYIYTVQPEQSQSDRNAWVPLTGNFLRINDMFRPEMIPPKDIPWQEAIWKIEAPK